MSNKAGSRGPTLDNDQLVQQVGGNRFELVLIAAQRAREIARAHRNSGKTESVYAPVSALVEIQQGKIGREYIRKIGK